MFNKPRPFLTLLAAILLFSILSPRVFASDDSNPTGLAPIINTTSASATTNQTLATMDQLSKENNITQNPNYAEFNQLKDQLESQAHAGNNIGSAQTLARMKDYLKTSQGQTLSPSLRALINSMTDGSSGLSVDPSALLSYIGGPDSNGMPTGLSGMDPNLAANDLGLLGALMSNIDPQSSAGLDLSRDANLLDNSISSGLLGGLGTGGLGGIGGGSQPQGIQSIPKIPNPISNLPGAAPGHPSLPGTPNIPTIKSSLIGGPSITTTMGQPSLPLILAVIAGIAGVLFLNRKRLGLLFRSVTPTSLRTKPLRPDLGLNLQNPRDLIIYYFRKVVVAMNKRGFPRLEPETHRESARNEHHGPTRLLRRGASLRSPETLAAILEKEHRSNEV